MPHVYLLFGGLYNVTTYSYHQIVINTLQSENKKTTYFDFFSAQQITALGIHIFITVISLL